jgi:hypothetical protein
MKYTLNGNEIKSQESVLGVIGAGIVSIVASIASTIGAMFLSGLLLISLITVVTAVTGHKDKKDLENKRKLVEEVKAKIPKEVWNKFIKDILNLLKDVEKSSKNLVSFVKDQYESVPNFNIVSEGKTDVYNGKKRSGNHPKNVSPKEIQKRLLKDICAEIVSSICSQKEFSLTGLEKRNGTLDFYVGSKIKDEYYYSNLDLDQNSDEASSSELLKLKENAKIYNEFEKGLESCCSVINTAISKGNFGSGFVKSFTSRNVGEVNYNFEDSYAYIYGDLDFVFDEAKIKTMITPIVKIIKENTNANGDK